MTAAALEALFRDAERRRMAGDAQGAVQAYAQVVRVAPRHAPAHAALTALLTEAGRPDLAKPHCLAALKEQPANPALHYHLGLCLDCEGRPAEALAAYRQAVRLQPGLAPAQLNLGVLLHAVGRLDEAEDALRAALQARPGWAAAHANLATVLKDQGFVVQAVQAAQQAVERDEGCLLGWHNLLGLQPYLGSAVSRGERERCLARYDRLLCGPVPPLPAPPDPAALQRPLRVGYVSADFRDHAVAWFIEPVLEHHDPAQVQVFCYDLVERRDAVHARLRTRPAAWRDCAGADDDTLAAAVAADGIDLLVDLMGHTGANRLPLFARRAAPVQASWLGWPASTGLSTMDFRIVDRHLQPAADRPEPGPETEIALPDTWLCYRPDVQAPAPRPRAGDGPVFGSFNGVYKLGEPVIEAWSALLAALPAARLRVVGVPDGRAEARLRDAFARRGVGERVELLRGCDLAAFFAHHHEVDVALDPFPFSASTTSLHALWMGVPVVTLAGRDHAGRMGLSLLRNLGLERCIAPDVAGYVQAAAALVQDRATLAEWRLSLRDRLLASPLTDAARFTRALEGAYREMLRRRIASA